MPDADVDAMTTPAKELPSAASVKPKSAIVSAYGVSSTAWRIASVPAGASFTGTTATSVVAVAELTTPSLTLMSIWRGAAAGFSLVEL
jgi:hypothetical protein